MKVYILSLLVCLGMLSAAEARVGSNAAGVHHVYTHSGVSHVHENDVSAAHPESAVSCNPKGWPSC